PAEAGQHAVAEAFHDPAAMALGHVPQQAGVGPLEEVGRLLAEVRAELGRTDEVRDDDGGQLSGHRNPLTKSLRGDPGPRPVSPLALCATAPTASLRNICNGAGRA